MKCFQGHRANKCHPPLLQEMIEQPVAGVWSLLLITSKEIVSISKTVTMMPLGLESAGFFWSKLERQPVVQAFRPAGHMVAVVTPQLCAAKAAMSST